MQYSFILSSMLVSLVVNCAGGSPIGQHPEDFTPNHSFTEGPGFKLCKKNPIRYNPKNFVCLDNEIICPILDQGSDNPHPMQKCGQSCFDDRIGSCENNKFIPGPPKRSWELGVDLAFAHYIQHAPPSHDGIHQPASDGEAAAQALLARYANAFGGTEEGKASLFKRYNEALTAEAQKYLEAEQKREDDQYLHLEKRWRRGSMKKDPVVRVKQTWDPRQRVQEEQNKGIIENGKSRTSEVLSTGEEEVSLEDMNKKVVRLPIRRPVVAQNAEEQDVEEDEEQEEERDHGYVAEKEYEDEDEEIMEEFEDGYLIKKRNLQTEFEEHMKELEKILATVV